MPHLPRLLQRDRLRGSQAASRKSAKRVGPPGFRFRFAGEGAANLLAVPLREDPSLIASVAVAAPAVVIGLGAIATAIAVG
jgi:hypothetical protein